MPGVYLWKCTVGVIVSTMQALFMSRNEYNNHTVNYYYYYYYLLPLLLPYLTSTGLWQAGITVTFGLVSSL